MSTIPTSDRWALEKRLPQVSLDQYNRQFKPATYNAFRDAVQEVFSSTLADQYINLFIDASIEQCGAPQYFGCAHKLRSLLNHSSHSEVLILLMDAHLANFSVPPDLPLHLELDEALIRKISRLAEIANGLPGWRARAAYAWLVSAEYALRAARSIYITRDHISYVREKAQVVSTRHETALYEMEHPDNE